MEEVHFVISYLVYARNEQSMLAVSIVTFHLGPQRTMLLANEQHLDEGSCLRLCDTNWHLVHMSVNKFLAY